MSGTAWFESFFGEDYLEIYRDAFPPGFSPRSGRKTSNGAIVLHERTWDLARDVMDDHVTLVRPDRKRRS